MDRYIVIDIRTHKCASAFNSKEEADYYAKDQPYILKVKKVTIEHDLQQYADTMYSLGKVTDAAIAYKELTEIKKRIIY